MLTRQIHLDQPNTANTARFADLGTKTLTDAGEK
jgi:hypothetical protein